MIHIVGILIVDIYIHHIIDDSILLLMSNHKRNNTDYFHININYEC